MAYTYYEGEVDDAQRKLVISEEELANARRNLERFERQVRINDPVYSRLFEAKNDTQRKLIIEQSYQAPPNEGVWYELQDEVDKYEREVKRYQREYDYYSQLSQKYTIAKGV
jgi:hypothetical protein